MNILLHLFARVPSKLRNETRIALRFCEGQLASDAQANGGAASEGAGG